MKKAALFFVIIIMVIIGCKKTEFELPEHQVASAKSLKLTNLRDSLIGEFSFSDVFLNTINVCDRLDTLGKTYLNSGNDCLGVFDWSPGVYCSGINPTKVEVASFDNYTLALTENGNYGKAKKFIICQNSKFYLSITINTVTVKDIIYENNMLKLTCNDSWARSSGNPDYYVLIDLN